MHMCITIDPGSWAQIARDIITDLKQRTTRRTHSYRSSQGERETPNLAIHHETHIEAHVQLAPIVSFFARLQPSTLEFYTKTLTREQRDVSVELPQVGVQGGMSTIAVSS